MLSMQSIKFVNLCTILRSFIGRLSIGYSSILNTRPILVFTSNHVQRTLYMALQMLIVWNALMIKVQQGVFISSLTLKLSLENPRNKTPYPTPTQRQNTKHWPKQQLNFSSSNHYSNYMYFFLKPPTLWCNNLGSTYFSVNPIMHSLTKHINIDFHFLLNRVATKTLHVAFI